MPIHDWTRVDAGIFHAFQHSWIEEIKRSLNRGVLPQDYYALAEQHAATFSPDVLTPLGSRPAASEPDRDPPDAGAGDGTALLAAPPMLAPTAETDMEFYRRKQTPVVVRHVSGDRVVAMIEVVSPGNKSTRHAIRSFVEKAAELLDRRVHLLILDLLPPGPRDPQGIHAALWDEIAAQDHAPPIGAPLTLAAYETELTVRAYVRPAAVGETLPDMPLFLEPGACVQVPLDATYEAAFAALPKRWRAVLEAPP